MKAKFTSETQSQSGVILSGAKNPSFDSVLRRAASSSHLSLRVWLFLLMFLAITPAASARKAAAEPAHPDATSALTEDKGKFRILINGQEAGKEEFSIASGRDGWTVHGATEIHSPQGASHVSGTIHLASDGTPVTYQWSTQGDKKASADIQFQGSQATVQLREGDAKPFTQQFTFQSPKVVVLDNNLYEQYAILADLYDWNAKGVQTMSVLVPQAMTPGDVTVQWVGATNSNGTRLDQLRVESQDLELNLFVDQGKLMRITVPSANAEIVRE